MRFKDLAALNKAIQGGDAQIVWNPNEDEANVLPATNSSGEFVSPDTELTVGRVEFAPATGALSHGDLLNTLRKLKEEDEKTEARQEMEKMGKSHLEHKFQTYWIQFGGSDRLITEHKFDIDGRKWRFDFSMVEVKIGIEINGGTFMPRGGHNFGPSMTKDYEKYNAATYQGWSVFLFSPDMLNANVAAHWIQKLIGWSSLSLLEVGLSYHKDETNERSYNW